MTKSCPEGIVIVEYGSASLFAERSLSLGTAPTESAAAA
jgi:hypothetical protein